MCRWCNRKTHTRFIYAKPQQIMTKHEYCKGYSVYLPGIHTNFEVSPPQCSVNKMNSHESVPTLLYPKKSLPARWETPWMWFASLIRYFYTLWLYKRCSRDVMIWLGLTHLFLGKLVSQWLSLRLDVCNGNFKKHNVFGSGVSIKPEINLSDPSDNCTLFRKISSDSG